MRILVTGAEGFVGKNLCAALQELVDGSNRAHSTLSVEQVYAYDIHTDPALLVEYCRSVDFVFHFAGVNRPQDKSEFMTGNCGFTATLIEALRTAQNPCPVLLASSIQASLIGRYGNSDYGKSKLAGEELLFAYGKESGARVLVYRFPNLFGRWCRPNYNSVVATFCHNRTRDLPIHVNDPKTELELLYIDDLIVEMLCALEGQEHRCEYDGLTPILTEGGHYCVAPGSHHVTLGRIVELLDEFLAEPEERLVQKLPDGSFDRKLFTTYLSYRPQVAEPLRAE